MTDALNVYLTTEYLYHQVCITCGHVLHVRARNSPDECPNCGGMCWKTLAASPHVAEPWYVQWLDGRCAICRQTQATIRGIDAQMELFKTT